MTEKEKMLRQMLYDANNDRDLIEERKVAKDLCYDFNHLRPSDTQQALPSSVRARISLSIFSTFSLRNSSVS